MSAARRPNAVVEALPRDYFARSPHDVGSELIGATLLVNGVGGVIVELEVYDRSDPASHGFRGKTKRNASMFGPPGHAYVYRSYGVHWCLNLVCEPEGVASALLVRALEPRSGLELMAKRRGTTDEHLLCSGPGRLCRALAITGDRHDGLALDEPPFAVLPRSSEPEIVRGERIGISRANERLWRLCLGGSSYLSRVPRRG